MTHRAESIMDSIKTTITGLTTTGANVSRGRAQPVETVPALTLEQGEDLVLDGSDRNMQFIDRLLEVRIIAHVKTGSQFDTALNVIKEEVYIAVMTDRQQGLSYVIDTMIQGDDAPELDVLEKNVGQQVMTFVVHYRHSITNPGA